MTFAIFIKEYASVCLGFLLGIGFTCSILVGAKRIEVGAFARVKEKDGTVKTWVEHEE